jgi:chemotaxis signal transduction protein
MHDDSIEDHQFTGETNSEESARKVQLFSAGSFHFGVYEDEVATIADWREPTPLPHAPEPVLGVVSIQGRMLTLLDPALLAGGETASAGGYRQIIALRGDEQLALAVSEIDELISHSTRKLEESTDHHEASVFDVLARADMEVKILNVSQLFPAALRGRERRRRRF